MVTAVDLTSRTFRTPVSRWALSGLIGAIPGRVLLKGPPFFVLGIRQRPQYVGSPQAGNDASPNRGITASRGPFSGTL